MEVQSNYETDAMDICKLCEIDYFQAIKKFYDNDEAALEFFRHHGIFPKSVICPRCNTSCYFYKAQNQWRCPQWHWVQLKHKKNKKTKKYCNFTKSDRKGTFLERSKIQPWKSILFCNQVINQKWDQALIKDYLNLSSQTLINCGVLVYEIAESWLAKQEPIGGNGEEVEVDVTYVVHRRNENIRIRSRRWLFAGIERTNKRKFMVALNEGQYRDTEMLLKVLQKNVKPGSVIYSNSGNNLNLSSMKCKHFAVDHSKNSGNSINSHIHTNNVQKLLCSFKDTIRQGINPDNLQQHIARFLFFSSFDNKKELLHHFFVEAVNINSFGSVRRQTAVNGQKHSCYPEAFNANLDDTYSENILTEILKK